MSKATQGVLLINLGTPDSPSVGDVRRYLREFLQDARVIDIAAWQRWLLVNLIIAPFRAPSSAKGYQALWTPEGSPLKFYGERAVKLLQEHLGPDYHVVLGMRYQNPSVADALKAFKDKGYSKITVIPLYPQYASATTGSTAQRVMEELNAWEVIPTVDFVQQFCEHPKFIKTFADIGREYLAKNSYEHILFSYHGLPERQIRKSSCDGYCQLNSKCCSVYHAKNRWCYRAQCFLTSRLLARELGISDEKYTVCFQSRLGNDPWIRPYIDDTVKELRSKNIRSVLVFSPAFVADCLETTIEIAQEYKHQFIEQGGERWDMVRSLNDHPGWIECLADLVQHA